MTRGNKKEPLGSRLAKNGKKQVKISSRSGLWQGVKI